VPAWVVEAQEFLLKAFDDGDWKVCVQRWVDMEKMLGYPDRKARHWVKTGSRPEQVGEWLKRHRVYTNIPDIGETEQYAESWRAWWLSLQPAWRVAGGSATWPLPRVAPDVIPEKDAQWSDLRKGGLNGFMVTLIALAWW
ncbi:hypothetical protein BV25DRAFT_1768228, partial [Artomyces pyxidatus]